MADDAPTAGPGGLEDVVDRAALAARLAALRDRAGLSVRDVARLSGLPLGTVGGYLSGRHLPQPATAQQFARVLEVLGVPRATHGAWLDVVARLRRRPGPRPASARPPYRGLEPYDVQDAPLYVGREDAVQELLDRVAARPQHPVVVMAASGSGKSSLLRAGLAARLLAQGRPTQVLTPGTSPRSTVSSAVDGLPVEGTDGVLVVDQFEEALLLAQQTPAPRDAVSALLEQLWQLHREGTTVVLGLRADVFDTALRHEALAAWLADGPVLIGPLSAHDLRRVVLEPSRQLGVHVDDALVDVLVAEATAGSGAGVGGSLDPGVLPLVSHALYATWTATSGHRLTLETYRAVGGLAGAIAQTAEQVVADLPAERLPAVRRLLLSLVELHGSSVTARPRDVRDLPEGDGSVVDALVAARLLTVDHAHLRLAHEALLDAWPRLSAWIEEDRDALRTHSRLIEAARHWADADHDPDLLYRGAQLQAALEWQTDQRSVAPPERAFLDASRADHDRRLRRRQRSARRLRSLSAGLAVLATATALLAGTALQQSRSAARERDLAVSRQLAVTAQSLAATDPGMAAQVAAAALATADTLESRSALLSATGAALPRRVGRADGLVNAVDVDARGDLLAAATDDAHVELWTLGDDPHVLAHLTVDDSALYGVAFTPDDRMLLAAGDGGRLRAWDLTEPDAPREIGVPGEQADATLYDVAVTGTDDTVLAAGGSDGSIRLWTRATDGAITPRASWVADPDSGGTVQAVAFAPDRAVLACAGSAGVVTLWDVRDPDAPARIGGPQPVGTAQIDALGWSPDGAQLAAGTTANLVELLDVSDPAHPVPGPTLSGPASWVNDVEFSPDGSRLAAASSDQHLWLWDTGTDASAGTIATPTTLLTARWSRDGAMLYTSGADGALREVPTAGPVLAGFASVPGQGAFGEVGRQPVVVTATTDGLRVWAADDPAHVRQLGAASPPRGARLDGAVDVSDELQLAVAGDTTGWLHAWDISDPGSPVLIGSVQAHTDWVDTVAFDPTGKLLAASSDDGSLTLWDLSTGSDLPERPAGRLGDLGGAVYVVAFSPDSRSLVASVLTGSVRLVDIGDPTDPRLLGDPVSGPEGYVYSTAYSPDGRTVAATGNDGTVWLWDVGVPDRPAPLGEPLRWGEGYGTNSAFSPDGRLLAVARTDGTVRLWDVSDPASPVRWATLSGTTGTVYGVEFSPDGTHLSGAGADRTVRIWDVTVSGALSRACASDDRGAAITDAEWARVAGAVERPSTC